MGVIFFIILILLLIIGITYTIKNKIDQTILSICVLLFIFFLIPSINQFPFIYNGMPKEAFSSNIGFFIGKLSYYIGLFVFLELTIIFSFIPIIKHKIQKKTNRHIECKICGRKISYNANGTCEECHQKILKRIEEKEISKIDSKRFCTKCGKEINLEWEFCNYCGNKLK